MFDRATRSKVVEYSMESHLSSKRSLELEAQAVASMKSVEPEREGYGVAYYRELLSNQDSLTVLLRYIIVDSSFQHEGISQFNEHVVQNRSLAKVIRCYRKESMRLMLKLITVSDGEWSHPTVSIG